MDPPTKGLVPILVLGVAVMPRDFSRILPGSKHTFSDSYSTTYCDFFYLLFFIELNVVLYMVIISL